MLIKDIDNWLKNFIWSGNLNTMVFWVKDRLLFDEEKRDKSKVCYLNKMFLIALT